MNERDIERLGEGNFPDTDLLLSEAIELHTAMIKVRNDTIQEEHKARETYARLKLNLWYKTDSPPPPTFAKEVRMMNDKFNLGLEVIDSKIKGKNIVFVRRIP